MEGDAGGGVEGGALGVEVDLANWFALVDWSRGEE